MSKALSGKSALITVLIIAFVIVAALSFIHFYSMVFAAGPGAMAGHAPCTAYLQISKFITPGPLVLFFSLIFSSIIFIKSATLNCQKFFRFLAYYSRWRFEVTIKSELIYNLLFRKGILHPKLYA